MAGGASDRGKDPFALLDMPGLPPRDQLARDVLCGLPDGDCGDIAGS